MMHVNYSLRQNELLVIVFTTCVFPLFRYYFLIHTFTCFLVVEQELSYLDVTYDKDSWISFNNHCILITTHYSNLPTQKTLRLKESTVWARK